MVMITLIITVKMDGIYFFVLVLITLTSLFYNVALERGQIVSLARRQNNNLLAAIYEYGLWFEPRSYILQFDPPDEVSPEKDCWW